MLLTPSLRVFLVELRDPSTSLLVVLSRSPSCVVVAVFVVVVVFVVFVVVVERPVFLVVAISGLVYKSPQQKLG